MRRGMRPVIRRRPSDSPAAADPLAAPAWSRTGLRWVARLSAAAAVILFALVLLAVHREALVHRSTDETVATFRLNNGYFDNRVNFAQTDRIRDSSGALGQTLEQLRAAATDDVALLETILPDTTRLLTAARTDLRIARELTGTADALRHTAQNILDTAAHSNNTVASADARLGAIADLVDQLNRRLSDIDRKLPLPSTGRTSDGRLTSDLSPRTEVPPR